MGEYTRKHAVACGRGLCVNLNIFSYVPGHHRPNPRVKAPVEHEFTPRVWCGEMQYSRLRTLLMSTLWQMQARQPMNITINMSLNTSWTRKLPSGDRLRPEGPQTGTRDIRYPVWGGTGVPPRRPAVVHRLGMLVKGFTQVV